ncbi:hypothetical protein Tco_1547834 [Tanacetum coccineum]
MLPTSTSAQPGSDKTNRSPLLAHWMAAWVVELNPKSFRQFHSNGKAHRPGPDSIVDCELLCHYDMLTFEHQHEIANQIGTTRSQIISNLNDLALGTSFL